VTSSAYVLYYVHHDILVGGMVPPLLEAPPPVANAPEEGRGDTPSKVIFLFVCVFFFFKNLGGKREPSLTSRLTLLSSQERRIPSSVQV
jgi:hypothetical protein